MDKSGFKEFLDAKVLEYNRPEFLKGDPLQVPHRFSKREDMEISGFLTATIAWGNRKSIIGNAIKMMELMDHAPHDFVMNGDPGRLERLAPFVHRTFNGVDLAYFIEALQNIYLHHGGLEAIFTEFQGEDSMQGAISDFKKLFFEGPHPPRTTKHISDPQRGSAAKRINMFLRWMVRDGASGVDLGLWKGISPAKLSCPLDVHSGNVARKLGLIGRRSNDAKALMELDASLREMDSLDPVKYDFALFGLGVFEKF